MLDVKKIILRIHVFPIKKFNLQIFFEPQLGSTLFLTLHEVLAFSYPVAGRVIYNRNLDFCGGDVSNSGGELGIQVCF